MSHRESEYQSYQATLAEHEDSVNEAIESITDEFKAMCCPTEFDLYADNTHEGEFTSIEAACEHVARNHSIGMRWSLG
jgi:NADPH-dependent 7-cyano-7-deazaguanine reductase QueF